MHIRAKYITFTQKRFALVVAAVSAELTAEYKLQNFTISEPLC